MPNIIEEAKAYAIAQNLGPSFVPGVEWALHKIAGEGNCIHFFEQTGSDCADLCRLKRGADHGHYLPEFAHKFQP